MNRNVLALSTALSILFVTPAFAAVDCTQEANKNDPACMTQQNNDNATSTTGNTVAPSASSTTTTNQNAQTTTASPSTMSTGELIVPADRLNNAQMMSANDFIGKTVYDQAGNNIGDVNDLIISQDGQIQAVILGVGGFLGIGEKNVAVNTHAIQMVHDGDNTRLVVQTNKEALNAAPTYDKNNRRYATQSSTTSDTTGSTTAPLPAPSNGDTTGNTTGSGMVDCTLAANVNDPACVNKTNTQQ